LANSYKRSNQLKILLFYVESRKPLPLPSKAKRGEITVLAAALELATLVLGPHIKVKVVA